MHLVVRVSCWEFQAAKPVTLNASSSMNMNLKQVSFFCVAVLGMFLCAGVAQACPMCSESIADDDSLPKAFMYSILFMLGMPATVLCGIGSVIYFKFRQFHAQQAIGIAGDDLVPTPTNDAPAAAETFHHESPTA